MPAEPVEGVLVEGKGGPGAEYRKAVYVAEYIIMYSNADYYYSINSHIQLSNK